MKRPRKTPTAKSLLDWYDRHRRTLPWRVAPGEAPDAYRVWLSEIMLQQTTVATVGPYFRAFTNRWPTVDHLAAAQLDEVLHAWQGLGYYARARNLHKCARVVASAHGGRFPGDQAALRLLPGIGRYTAAAIAAIAFGRRAVVVDGNVERVMARVFRIEAALPGAKPVLYDLAGGLTPQSRPGDYAQAVMDLGATICTPRRPNCPLCPWKLACAGRQIADSLPRRAARPERPTRRGVAFWITRPDGAVLLRRRPESGLLGGMIELPSTEWHEGPAPSSRAAGQAAPLAALDWRPLPGTVSHTFTHFHLELCILAGRVANNAAPQALWSPPDQLGDYALPTIMKKLARHAQKFG